MPLQACPAGLLGHFAPSDFTFCARLSSKAQLCLPHVTSSVPRSIHAKFHADRCKTVGARRIQTDSRTDKQTNRPVLIIWISKFSLPMRHVYVRAIFLVVSYRVMISSAYIVNGNCPVL